MSLNELLVYKIFVSSAKLCTFENEIALFRALIQIKHKRSPSRKPCGLPYLMLEFSDR